MLHIQNQTFPELSKSFKRATRMLGKTNHFSLGDLPGLSALLKTFPSITHDGLTGSGSESVPFNQCVDVPRFPIQSVGEITDLALMSAEMRAHLEVTRKAIQCLLWEGFFTGQSKPTRNSYQQLALARKGASFWYSDFIMSQAIRKATPRGEVVPNLGPQSMHIFHSYRAFSAAGLTDSREVLNFYIKSFCKLTRSHHQFSQHFATFYRADMRAPLAAFDVLKVVGIWDEYFERFCAIPGIPQICSDCTSADGLAQILKAVACLPTATLKRIRLRRALQTRAYFAFSIRHMLTLGSCILPKGSVKRDLAAKTLEELSVYLEDVEVLLRSLAAGRAPATVDFAIRKSDVLYQKTVGRRLAGAWAKRRTFLTPSRAERPSLEWAEDRSTWSTKELLEFADKLANGFALSRIDLGTSPEKAIPVLRSIEKINVLRNEVRLKPNPPTCRALSRQCDRLLRLEPVLAGWSVLLSEFNPVKNCFRELLFLGDEI